MLAFLETYKKTILEMEKHYKDILKMKDDASVQIDCHATMCDKPTAEQLPSHVTYSHYKTALKGLETCEDEELKKNYQQQKEIFESLWHDYNKMNAFARFQGAFSILEKAYGGTHEKIQMEHDKILKLQEQAKCFEERKRRKITK